MDENDIELNQDEKQTLKRNSNPFDKNETHKRSTQDGN